MTLTRPFIPTPTSNGSLPASKNGKPTRRPLRPRDFGGRDLGLILASLVSSFCVVWIIFGQLTLLSGGIGFLVTWIITFLVMYWVVNSLVFGSRVATDRAVASLITVGALCLLTPLVLLVAYLFIKGAGLLFRGVFPFVNTHLFTASQNGVEVVCIPGIPCNKPGILNALVGTGEQLGIAVMIGVPAGLLTAVYLNEVGGRFTQVVRVVVTSMSGLPAILAGAFVYSFWINGSFFHFGYSGFAGALALSVILLPTVTRGSEEVLRIVPNDLREASIALAAPEWRTTWSVVLPTARSGLVTAVLLAIAVALGETAPLLLTIFGSAALNVNPFHNGQEALPLLIYSDIKVANKDLVNLAYVAALVLFLGVFLLFVLARVLSSDWLGNRFRKLLNTRMNRSDSQPMPARKVP
jgi:phosphate transport system permease protein